jgi:hypothetical protein
MAKGSSPVSGKEKEVEEGKRIDFFYILTG